jgi:hypothetical protein
LFSVGRCIGQSATITGNSGAAAITNLEKRRREKKNERKRKEEGKTAPRTGKEEKNKRAISPMIR